MIPWEILGRARAEGGAELVLHHRDGEFVIRANGRDLMSSQAHGSEEDLARLACAAFSPRDDPRILVGGLGLGYTVRAALDRLPPAATVVVVELVEAVVDWNRGPLAPLAARPLDDPRVKVEVADVTAFLGKTTLRFDAILLDVDNGPEALTRMANQLLYAAPGLDLARRCLRRGGALAVWSAFPDDKFAHRFRRAGFSVAVHTVRARGTRGGARHTIFAGTVPR